MAENFTPFFYGCHWIAGYNSSIIISFSPEHMIGKSTRLSVPGSVSPKADIRKSMLHSLK